MTIRKLWQLVKQTMFNITLPEFKTDYIIFCNLLFCIRMIIHNFVFEHLPSHLLQLHRLDAVTVARTYDSDTQKPMVSASV